jgi:hypothetical protein
MMLSTRTGYPPPDSNRVRHFFKRRSDETDGKLADRYAAFVYALFRAARLLVEPVAGTEYSLLASALYELLSKDQSSATTPPALREKLYDVIVEEAEVRQCFTLLERSL